MTVARRGFKGLVGILPRRRAPVAEMASDLGYDAAMAERLRQGGLGRVPVDEQRPVAGLIGEALADLTQVTGRLAGQVGLVVLAHSVTMLAPGGCDPVAAALDAVGLDAVPRLAISGQPCAILHFAVARAAALLGSLPPGRGVLVIGADKAWRDQDRLFFGSAMGDCVIVGLLTAAGASHQVLASASLSRIVACDGEDSPSDAIGRFRDISPFHLRDTVQSCLADAGCQLSDLAWIAPHTPHHAMWDTMCAALRFPRERVLTHLLAETGHLNSNDSFFHYLQAAADGLVRRGDLVLLVNPGFGGTWGCTLMRR